MAVPSVQGFAKWNLERCPEVLEAKHLMHENNYHVREVRWFGGLLIDFALIFWCCYSLICLPFCFFSFFVFARYHHFGFNDLSFFNVLVRCQQILRDMILIASKVSMGGLRR